MPTDEEMQAEAQAYFQAIRDEFGLADDAVIRIYSDDPTRPHIDCSCSRCKRAERNEIPESA